MPTPDATRPQAPFELGVYSFAERTPDPRTGRTDTPAQRLQDLVEEIVLADQVGLDAYGLGEHHRPEYVSSAPAVTLAAAAARTSRIRLSSAVTVLGSDDPVRVFQSFATLDLLSAGRAEIMAGRGSFIESFPLFGYDLNDYEALFEEKLDLLLRLRERERVTWQGRHRPALQDDGIYPRPQQARLPVWLAVGGTPASAVRAGTLGLPMALAIIGGTPERFTPLVELYREAGRRAGHDPAALKLGVNGHGFLADTHQEALDVSYPSAAAVMNQIGRERGWPPMSRRQYERDAEPDGHLLLGDPDRVAAKILHQHELFGHDRVMIQFSVGSLPHDRIMKAIEAYGTRVAPQVRDEVARRAV